MRLFPVRAAAGLAAAVILAVPPPAPGAEPGPPPTLGWRGNWTGLFLQADPPLEWARIARGVVAGMTCQAARPANGAPCQGEPVRGGLVRDWLILGPLAVADSVKDFDQAQVPGEGDLKPAEGEKAGDLAWQRLQLKPAPDYERWGTTELDWIDLSVPLGYKPNQVAYAHTYLHCAKPGRVRVVLEHMHGLKAWLNGRPVYGSSDRGLALGSYAGISRQKRDLVQHRSPQFEAEVQQGWNHLLVKASTFNQRGSRSFQFTLRILDAGPVPYEEKNIAWVAPMPERTNASPILVGDRLFTPAEPDELLCVDKRTGKVLWRRSNGLLEATPEEERAHHPVFREKIAPLAAQLAAETDFEKSLELRRNIRDLLEETDKKRYGLKWDGHLESHFGIVGFTTTPVSDGKHIWAFYGNGVVACYDLEGNRRWIRRLEAPEIVYSCTPALIGNRLACIFGGLHGLDAGTGKTAWFDPDVKGIASLVPATLRGTDVVVTRQGEVLRAADGKLLWRNPHIRSGDTGWGPPVILGEAMYLPWLGVSNLIVADFSRVSGEKWEPQVQVIEVDAVHRRPDGSWLDRWTPCSPVVFEGTYYNLDQYGWFYAVDLASKKTLYRKDTGFDELHHYNAIGVGASPALAGRRIYGMDNQGTCVVIEPGREYKQVAVNRIETQIARVWPVPPQEILANGAPIFEGKHMYLRGEQHLYCIGPKR